MKNGSAQRGQVRSAGGNPGLAVVPPTLPPAIPIAENGIVVSEQELGSVKAQRLYKMRCECGRSWFELELPTLVPCPACKKLCLVSA